MPPRHLLYHLHPAGNWLWKWNLDHLFRRWALFDGRKLVYVALEAGGPTVREVERRFRGRDAELRFVTNRSAAGEATSFLPGWEELRNEAGYVFRAHAKGVSREGSAAEPAVCRWVEHLYRESLDNWDRVEQSLSTSPIVGPLMLRGDVGQLPDVTWHYCGSFYWVRLAALKHRPWRVRDNSRFAAEAWPGRVFRLEEAACLGRENPGTVSPYELRFWQIESPRQDTPTVRTPEVNSPTTLAAKLERAHPPTNPPIEVETKPTVAVVVPCHNYGHWLGECLDSILAQSFPPVDIVVVDDASTDETAAVARSYAPRGVRVLRVRHHDPHQTRRAGIAATSSDFVCCVDADDRLTPRYLEQGLLALRDPEVALAYSPIQEFGMSRRLRQLSPGNIERHNWIHAGAIVRRRAIESSGAYDTGTDSLTEDWEVWKRILRCGWKTARNPERYEYRRHGTGRSQTAASRGGRVILSTYLTSRRDPQGTNAVARDRWDLVAPWAEGINRCGLRGVILHDGLSRGFIERLESLGIECVSCDPIPATTHANNWRFRLAAEWVGSHHVTAAFLTDLFDISVKADPFALLDQHHDLWIGHEPWTIGPDTPAGRWMLSRLRGTYGDDAGLLGRTILNAGITGGHRAPVLTLWWSLWNHLKRRGPDEVRASDMAALNWYVERQTDPTRVWCRGAPLHSVFKAYQHDAPVCFVHK